MYLYIRVKNRFYVDFIWTHDIQCFFSFELSGLFSNIRTTFNSQLNKKKPRQKQKQNREIKIKIKKEKEKKKKRKEKKYKTNKETISIYICLPKIIINQLTNKLKGVINRSRIIHA